MDKGMAILDAGWELFLERGVEATPIEAIAAKAGVSKVTLYTHYSDKTALFRAAVEREMERIEAAQQRPVGDGRIATIAEQLRLFGLGIMTFLTSKPAIDFYSVVAGELRRHDELARAFYALGPGRTRHNLAGVIAAATARGELVAVDPEHAADELFGMWQGFTNFQMSLGIEIDAVRQGLPRRVERAVALFLRLYGRQTAPNGRGSHTPAGGRSQPAATPDKDRKD
jgi:TetR/AcrR family transcriptional repressor of mexJK operon